MRRRRLLLVTSNGWGMGHLTRQLAIAMAGQDQAESALFSHSLGLPAVIGKVPGEYCPGADRQWVKSPAWHAYLADRLVAIARETEAEVLLYDGVSPYPGLLRARSRLPQLQFVWMRRGLWRPGMNVDQLEKSWAFDHVIEPGDIAAEADRGATALLEDAVKVAPISMLEVVEPLSRPAAAEALGIDPDRRTVLVTLGSGRLGDITAPGTVVLKTLLEDPEWQICLTKASIALQGIPVIDPERIVQLEGVYPLVKYLRAFDAVVSATGYNAVHEFVSAALPTLFVPNPVTHTDDQEARARWLHEQGLALATTADQTDRLAFLTRSLSNPSVREELHGASSALPSHLRLGGARQAAEILIDLAGNPRPAGRSVGKSGPRWGNRPLRTAAKAVLGPSITNQLRRLAGKPTYEVADQRLPVRVVDSTPIQGDGVAPLYFGERVTAEMVRQNSPVEHLLARSSPRYRRQRMKLIHRYYSVVD